MLQNVVVEKFLQFFIAVIDAELFERINRKIFCEIDRLKILSCEMILTKKRTNRNQQYPKHQYNNWKL